MSDEPVMPAPRRKLSVVREESSPEGDESTTQVSLPSVEALCGDLRMVIETGISPERLLGCTTLLSLRAVDRRAQHSRNPAVRAESLTRLLHEVIFADLSRTEDRRVASYLLGAGVHRDTRAPSRKQLAAEARGCAVDYFRKGPTSTLVELVAFHLLRREASENEEPGLEYRRTMLGGPYILESFDASFYAPSQFLERRTIRALDRLDSIPIGFSYYDDPDGTGLRLEVLENSGEIRSTQRFADDYVCAIIGLPATLEAGETHELVVRKTLLRPASLDPVYGLAPSILTRHLTVRVKFADRRPVRIWYFDGIPTPAVPYKFAPDRELNIDDDGNVEREFPAPERALAYGLSWEWE